MTSPFLRQVSITLIPAASTGILASRGCRQASFAQPWAHSLQDPPMKEVASELFFSQKYFSAKMRDLMFYLVIHHGRNFILKSISGGVYTFLG